MYVMNEIASKSQLRMSYFRWALFCVSIIVLLGTASGYAANSGYQNQWFAALDKPALTPPGWVFGTVWPALYVLLGLSLALVVTARRALGRGLAITLFVVQLVCNYAWSPLFFAAHEATLAFYLIVLILLLTLVCALLFARIRLLAALLLVPYIAWLCFAGWLSFEIDRRNPGAETLVAPAFSTQI